MSGPRATRQQAGDIILQARYDEALDRLGPEHPEVRTLRERVVSRGLNTRDQGVLPVTDEPWAGQANPIAAGRMRLEHVRRVDRELRELDRLMTWDERATAEHLKDIILNGRDPALVSEAHSRMQRMLRDIAGRSERPREARTGPRFVRTAGAETLLYTLGKRSIYENPRDIGRHPRKDAGGSVWRTRDDAERYRRENGLDDFGVYAVRANWDDDVSPSDEGNFGSLKRIAPLIISSSTPRFIRLAQVKLTKVGRMEDPGTSTPLGRSWIDPSGEVLPNRDRDEHHHQLEDNLQWLTDRGYPQLGNDRMGQYRDLGFIQKVREPDEARGRHAILNYKINGIDRLRDVERDIWKEIVAASKRGADIQDGIVYLCCYDLYPYEERKFTIREFIESGETLGDFVLGSRPM